MPQSEQSPASEADRTLDLAALHLQMLLQSVASFDGKIMFLTALNTAGMSALIGIWITSAPVLWLMYLGMALLVVSVLAGLGVLWSTHLLQFPSPVELIAAKRLAGAQQRGLTQRHFDAITQSIELAENVLRLRIRTMRTMLVLTPIALALVLWTARTAVG